MFIWLNQINFWEIHQIMKIPELYGSSSKKNQKKEKILENKVPAGLLNTVTNLFKQWLWIMKHIFCKLNFSQVIGVS